MNITQLSSRDLKKAMGLVEKKELHLARIAEIDRQIDALFGGLAVPTAGANTVLKPSRGKNRGKVKAAIVTLLQQAGSEGVTLKEISRRLGMAANRLNTWFYITGRAIKQVKRIERGRYAWVE